MFVLTASLLCHLPTIVPSDMRIMSTSAYCTHKYGEIHLNFPPPLMCAQMPAGSKLFLAVHSQQPACGFLISEASTFSLIDDNPAPADPPAATWRAAKRQRVEGALSQPAAAAAPAAASSPGYSTFVPSAEQICASCDRWGVENRWIEPWDDAAAQQTLHRIYDKWTRWKQPSDGLPGYVGGAAAGADTDDDEHVQANDGESVQPAVQQVYQQNSEPVGFNAMSLRFSVALE